MKRSATAMVGAAAVAALLSLPAYTVQSAESAADPGDFAACLTEHGVPADLAGPPRGPGGPDGPPPGRPDGPPPGGHPGAPGERPAPPVPEGVDPGTWNDAFASCAEFAPAHPPGHPGPPA
ncbi:MAG: hypothetical protein SW019_05705 [Actinomycetota bacterium]|nr:hypothetical protein [Actinomycetota bacterium]